MALNKIVTAPPNIIEEVVQLAAVGKRRALLNGAPGEHGDGKRHWQAELHMVAGVEEAAGKIHAVVRAVVETAVAAPLHAVVGGHYAGALLVIKVDGLLERVSIVVA